MTTPQSIPRGPSEDYLRLLRGEISAAEYLRRIKQRFAQNTTTRGAS